MSDITSEDAHIDVLANILITRALTCKTETALQCAAVEFATRVNALLGQKRPVGDDGCSC